MRGIYDHSGQILVGGLRLCLIHPTYCICHHDLDEAFSSFVKVAISRFSVKFKTVRIATIDATIPTE
jgi:hypothetical protein